jgi:hypothetical protein
MPSLSVKSEHYSFLSTLFLKEFCEHGGKVDYAEQKKCSANPGILRTKTRRRYFFVNLVTRVCVCVCVCVCVRYSLSREYNKGLRTFPSNCTNHIHTFPMTDITTVPLAMQITQLALLVGSRLTSTNFLFIYSEYLVQLTGWKTFYDANQGTSNLYQAQRHKYDVNLCHLSSILEIRSYADKLPWDVFLSTLSTVKLQIIWLVSSLWLLTSSSADH